MMKKNRKTLKAIKRISEKLEESRFPKSGKVLVLFIIKIHYINSSMVRSCEVKNYYSTCILFRSLLEHYFRHLYVYTRTLRENSDVVGSEYYGKLKGYEDLTYMISMQNLDKKLSKEESVWKFGGDQNKVLKEVGGKFEIKRILAFLNEELSNDDIKPAFKSFFTEYCNKYYNLSSFVHGGPFAEGYLDLYSKNKEGLNKDLEYFFKESAELLDRTIENTQLFLDITSDAYIAKIYAEIGFGNESFLSTEYEEGEKEYRVPKFIKPKNIEGYYIRIWIFKKVFIFSTNGGFETTAKNKNKFKLLFGISGTS